MDIISLNKEICTLTRLFQKFNKRFYNEELECPVIVIQSGQSGRKYSTLGYCTTQKVWKDRKHNQYFYEIAIISNFLYRPVGDICATLLHEMVHLYNIMHHIQDCSRGGTYHNKKFKIAAEEHGLDVELDNTYGWTITKLNMEADKYIKKVTVPNMFNLVRVDNIEDDNNSSSTEKKKGKSYRYVCPGCEAIVRTTKKLNIKCVDCDLQFIES